MTNRSLLGILPCIVAAISLGGCATATKFRQSKLDSPAVLEESRQRSAFLVWQDVQVFSIDGKVADAGFLTPQGGGRFKIDPGMRHIVANVRFNQGSGVFEGKAVIDVDLRSATTYTLAGKVVDAEVQVWVVEKKTGQAVSEVARGPFMKAPKVVGVPIII
ncbi:hypothetical protein ACFJIW_18775 [Tahibacter sp. UC22_41]|uniref:hypothetical protein n=1 Tax=Tahibacter sp. UC22_41 TaxID=3350178 RepID=UPI0036DA67AE